ncbi:MAG: SAM-dependent methyltransferase [Planctomycetes bacterium]|nr:SAM-dependent methyltransferase [Planctomycetota bacterium]
MTDAPLEILADAITRGECLLLVMSRLRPDAAKSVNKVSVRPMEIQRQPMFQFTHHQSDRVTHENLTPTAAARKAVLLMQTVFQDANLFTTQADYSMQTRRKGTMQCVAKPPTKAGVQQESIGHNRSKEHLIPAGVPCPFLVEIGVMTPAGQVRSAMTRKFRQINRFLELVDDIVPALLGSGPGAGRELRVVDFGCGKSYLTFALHHLLTEIHACPVRIVGLDRKVEVMQHCAEIAGRLQCQGLEFRCGDIVAHEETEPIDLAVSLHACDTATDDALEKALRWGARVILAVPCCQHELARSNHSRDLGPLLQHGILREQFSALATDALRALALEARGYATQVVEFIDLEHTAKNILIRAVRRERADESSQAERVAAYHTLKSQLGLGPIAVDRLLPVSSG